jgi:hypothetical protein
MKNHEEMEMKMNCPVHHSLSASVASPSISIVRLKNASSQQSNELKAIETQREKNNDAIIIVFRVTPSQSLTDPITQPGSINRSACYFSFLFFFKRTQPGLALDRLGTL